VWFGPLLTLRERVLALPYRAARGREKADTNTIIPITLARLLVAILIA